MRVCSAMRLISTALLSITAWTVIGCFSDRGVAIEIDVGRTGATRVELYLGTQFCDPEAPTAGITCETIAPPDGTHALQGNVWFRDALMPEVAEVKGRKAAFQLKVDASTTVPIAIAVGIASNDQGMTEVGVATLRDLAIPADDARVVTATLAPASRAQPGSPDDNPGATGDRVLVWRKTTPPSSCVLVEHGTDPVSRDFVVPAEDPDCDDAAAPECNPAAHLSTNLVPGALAEPACFSRSDGSACVLGAFGCTDTVPGTNDTCAPLSHRTCVPSAFCDNCTTTYDDVCTRDQLGLQSTAARIDCSVPTTLSVGNLSLCPASTQARVNLDMFFPNSRCPQPELGALPGVGFAVRHSFGGATMELSSPTEPCQFTITWIDGTRPALDPPDDFGIIQFASDGSPTVHLPIVLHFLPPAENCFTTGFQCSFAGPPDDALWTCVQ